MAASAPIVRDLTGDTIVALSSGTLPSGVAVVRMSGPATSGVLSGLIGDVPTPRQAQYRTIRDPDGEIIDRGLVIYFQAPGSFTGEDVAEFQVHGGRAVVARLLSVLTGFRGCRVAEAGEFTRRAFTNGKLDLLEAEATADLIAAETEAERRFAVEQQAGANLALYQAWRERLIKARALIEADLDFSDQDDVSDAVADRVWPEIRSLLDEVAAHRRSYTKAELLRDGYQVVLTGAPNAGKSSLLNALLGREAAIVSSRPGTTRDLIEATLDLDGRKVRIVDTAGLRETADDVEQQGIDRAMERIARADLILACEDGSDPEPAPYPAGENILRIRTKLDLAPASTGTATPADFQVSVKSGEGLDVLMEEISRRARAASPPPGELIPWRSRHIHELDAALAHLEMSLIPNSFPEVRSEGLRLASVALGRLVGEIDVEHLLNRIFSTFCIGK